MLPLLEATTPPAGLIDAMWHGDALGVLLRGWVPLEELVSLRGSLPAVAARPLAPHATVMGCMLAPTLPHPEGPDLDDYLDAAAQTRAAGIPPDAALGRIDAALEVLAGRPVVGLCLDERPYAAATLRIFRDGAEAPLHNDRYRALPCHRALDEEVDRRTQLSWYVGVASPDAGGELTIVEGDDAQTVDVAPGDLIVFDGGRFDHRVERCTGPRERRTLGGFAGIARDGRSLHRWS